MSGNRYGGNVQRFDPMSTSGGGRGSQGMTSSTGAGPRPPMQAAPATAYTYATPPQQQHPYQNPPGAGFQTLPRPPPPPRPSAVPHPQHAPPPPPAQPVMTAPQQPNPNQLAFLQSQGFPLGMIQTIMNVKDSFPLRVWILDNSTSMKVRDSHVLKPDYQQVSVTRWEELRDCVSYHSDFYTLFGMPTRFALLSNPQQQTQNHPPPPQYFSLLQTGNLAQEQQVLRQVLTTVQPHGPTTLTAQLNILIQYIASVDAALRARRHTLSIVLTTQGLPTNEKGESSPQIVEEFVQTLRRLETYPVWLVLRLCSDDEKAFEFYNALDSQDNLDVLDDFYGEALEVYLRNPWLCYALVLHRFRESGLRHSGLDAMDERALSFTELRDLGQFLFGVALLPDPAVDWNGFIRALEACMVRERPHWNPILKTVTPWINIALLNATYGRGPYGRPVVPPPQPSQRWFPQQQQQQQAHPPFATTPPAPAPSSNSTSPTSKSAADQTLQQTGTSDTSDIKNAIEKTWAKEPPAYAENKNIAVLLGTLHLTFELLDPPEHEYFSKYHSFSQDALKGQDLGVLKHAVRKTRLFLHPDKLPKDLNEQQQLLCRVLWDTISEAWSHHTNK